MTDNKELQKFSSTRIINTPVHRVTLSDALDIVDEAVRTGESLSVGCVNAGKIVKMESDQLLHRDVTGSDLVLADGMSVVWASKILGERLPERVTGIDLMMGILARGEKYGCRVYCFGATEEVSLKVEEEINRQFPGIKLVGRRNGYYTDADEEAIANDIAACNVDVLFVAITSPKKENFMAKWGDVSGATVVHGVGGSFDVLAGKVQRAPDRWQSMGLEWLYRVKQEPRRLWKRYLTTNVAFVWLILKSLFSSASAKSVDSAPGNSQ